MKDSVLYQRLLCLGSPAGCPLKHRRELYQVTRQAERPPASQPAPKEARHSLPQGMKANVDLSIRTDAF